MFITLQRRNVTASPLQNLMSSTSKGKDIGEFGLDLSGSG
jgi:hypothetical protein